MYTMTGLDRLIGFDPQLLHDSILTGINIFILFFLLSYLLFNPVRDVLEKRKKKIADELASAAGDMASASALKDEYEAKLKNVNKEAEDILETPPPSPRPGSPPPGSWPSSSPSPEYPLLLYSHS